MKVKLILASVLLLLSFVLPVALATPTSAWCSGDLCGCGYYFEECRFECNGDLTCINECKRENIQCSKVCCAGNGG